MANRRILLVEGVDDEHVMKHICGNHGIPELDEIKQHGGAPNLLESVPVRIKASEEGDVVGVVMDADTDLHARWQSIRGRIIAMGYEDVPGAPTADGTIISFRNPASFSITSSTVSVRFRRTSCASENRKTNPRPSSIHGWLGSETRGNPTGPRFQSASSTPMLPKLVSLQPGCEDCSIQKIEHLELSQYRLRADPRLWTQVPASTPRSQSPMSRTSSEQTSCAIGYSR